MDPIVSLVEVVVPWRGGCLYREKAWEQVRSRYDWPVTVAEGPPGAWVKALAVMPAVEASPAGVVVLADADCWTDGLLEAVQAVEDGSAWAIPHLLIHRLAEDGSPEEKPYRGIEGGGIVVAHRDTLLDVPLDPRFAGWGQEDQSHGVALRTLVGPPWRGTADLIHWWHPPQERLSRTRGSRENWNLRRRYMQARARPNEMRTLILEAQAALATAQQGLHPHAAYVDGQLR